MSRRRSLLLLAPYAILAFLIGWVSEGEGPWRFPVRISCTDATDPFTPDRLRARLARIAPLVSGVVGTPLEIDDLEVVVRDDRVAAEEKLRASFAHLLDTRRADFQQGRVSFAQLTLQQVTAGLLAEYLPAQRRIAVQPFGHEVLAPEAVASLLDVVLAHELAHAWQDQCFEVFEQEGVASTEEADLARAAVVEGSAELVARSVARRLGTAHLFDRMTAAREDQSAEGAAVGAQRALARWVRWVYGEGLRFIDVVHQAEGTETWDRLFSAMPTDVWSIEHPRAWLARGGAPIEDLDGWADRLVGLLDAAPASPVPQGGWDHGPALRADVERRLEIAGLSPEAASWDGCQGGVVLAGRPRRGPLAGTALVLHAWRFPTGSEAREARASLVRAFEARGPVVWAGEDADEVVGASRVRDGAGGARARTSLLFDDALLHAHEGAWALRVEGSLLLEVFAWREGIAPALLEILEVAAAAREDADAEMPLRDERLAQRLAEADGEAAARAWLDAHGTAAAWMTALGPGAGEEDVEDLERGRILAGALASEDDDLVRFALSALADNRATLSPLDTDVLDRVAALTAHPDPWIRTVAVLAADALGDEHPLDDVRIGTLAEDESPAVRAALALGRSLQGQTVRRVRRELRKDPHPAVRRAAGDEKAASQDPVDAFVDAILGTRRDAGGEASGPPRDDPRDRAAAARLVWEVMGRAASGRVDEALIRRIRRLLVSPDEIVRIHALSMVMLLEDERARFLPELVRALTEAGPRRLAVQALTKGGLDLAPAAVSLRKMLEHPRMRPDVLRVLAANDLALEPADLGRARAWMDAADAQVAAASALLLLARDVDEAHPLQVLESAWDLLPEGWREEALRAIVTHRPGSEVGRRLLARALRSPLYGERGEALGLLSASADAEGLEPLLDAMDDVGPAVAEELLTRFLEAAQELGDAEGEQAGRLLARHLERWCDSGRLPAVDADVLMAWTWPELPGSPELVHALDRCLRLEDPSVLRHVLALLRSVLDRDRWPEDEAVGAAMERLCSLTNAPEDLSSWCARPLLEVYADLETVDPAAVHVVLRRAARPAREGDSTDYDVEGVLEDHPRRIEAALELVPQLLDAGTSNATATALTVLEVAGPRARELLDRFRALAPRLLPSWRRRVEAAIEKTEETETDD